MSSLPTIDPYDYWGRMENNNQIMEDKLRELFPETQVPYDYIGQLLTFLQETKVNARILPKVIRGVHNILLGTGQGQVIIHVRQDTVNVSVRENDSEEVKAKT